MVDRILASSLKDDTKCWQMNAHGAYSGLKSRKEPFAAHEYFMTNPSLSGRGSALKKGRKKTAQKKTTRKKTTQKK